MTSLAQHNQSLRLREEEARRQRERDAIMRPVEIANAQAEVAKANAGVVAIQRNEQLREELHKESSVAEEEWTKVMGMSDPKQMADAAVAWTGRWMKFSALKDFSPLWEQRKELAGKFYQHATDMEKLSTQIAGQKDVAGIRANAPTGFAHLVSSYQAAIDAGDTETANLLKGQIDKRNHVATPYSDADRIKQLESEADLAEKEGDTNLATALRSRIKVLTTPRGSGKTSLDEKLGKLGAALGAPATPVLPSAGPAQPAKPAAVVPPTLKF
jgi:hypothetical protein